MNMWVLKNRCFFFFLSLIWNTIRTYSDGLKRLEASLQFSYVEYKYMVIKESELFLLRLEVLALCPG